MTLALSQLSRKVRHPQAYRVDPCKHMAKDGDGFMEASARFCLWAFRHGMSYNQAAMRAFELLMKTGDKSAKDE